MTQSSKTKPLAYSVAFEADYVCPEQLAAMSRGLQEPDVRAFVIVVGLLATQTKRSQARILRFVADVLEEERGDGAPAIED